MRYLLLALVALGCASRLTAAEKPNVVVILADDEDNSLHIQLM